MQITNIHNLPESIVNLVKNDSYNSGHSDITVTQLIDSPRVVNMKKIHAAKMTQDVSDMMFLIMGKLGHALIENSKGQEIKEERLFAKIKGWNISGAIDSQDIEVDGTTIGDYKFTSVWAVMNEKPDWEYQLNMYAWLVEKVKGHNIKGLKIYAFCRDWNRRDAVKDNYPKTPLVVIDIPLWDMAKREAFVLDCLHRHAEADTTRTLGGDLPLCSDADQWRRQETYAAMKTGAKRATRVFDKKMDADLFAVANGLLVVTRPAEPTRCKGNFCRVAEWCDQYKSEAV